MLPSNEFWRNEDLALWGAVDEVALAAVLAGARAGQALLPAGVSQLASLDSFNQAAMAFLRRYQLMDVPNINQATRSAVIRLISDWLRDGESLQTLERRMATIPAFSDARARMIAITEVTRLFAQGNQMFWMSTGVVTSKVWRTARDEKVCPLCGPLDGQVVEIEKNFTQGVNEIASSPQMKALLGPRWSEELALHRARNLVKWHMPGVNAPPRHVNCRCWLQPVVSVESYRDLVIT